MTAGERDRQSRGGVAALAAGTIAAQAVGAAALPLFARLFSPGDFGVASLFWLVCSVVAAGATGRYAVALVLPTSERLAAALARLALGLTGLAVALTSLMVGLDAELIATALGEAAAARWLLLVPLAVGSAGLFEVLSYQCTRWRAFGALGAARAVRGVGATIATLALGAAGFGVAALVMGPLAVHALTAGTLAAIAWRRFQPGAPPRRAGDLRRAACLYRTFPAFDLPNTLAHTGSTAGTVLLLGTLFGPEPVGLLTFAQRLMVAPFTAMTSALGTARYADLAALFRADRALFSAEVERSLTVLARWLVPAFALGALVSPWLVEPLLGARWAGIETYVVLLAPPLCLELVMAPVSYVLKIVNRPGVSLALNTGLLLAKAGALVGASLGLGLSLSSCLWAFSLAWYAMLLVNLLVLLRHADARPTLIPPAVLLGFMVYALAPGSPLGPL